MSPLVATLVADPGQTRLRDAGIARIAQAAPGLERWRWLDEGVTADLFLAAGLAAACAALTGALAGEPVDAVIQPARGYEKRLLVADMDSTLIRHKCADEPARSAGVGAKVAAITEQGMRGEIAFEPPLRERVAPVGGVSVSVIRGGALRDRITLLTGARTMQARVARVAVVSSGFRQFTFDIAERASTLTKSAPTMGLEPTAVGDRANDLAMLRASGLGVADCAKPKVVVAAEARIDRSDLTTLLYAQEIARTDFVEG
jgi:phosphoserine phosphatase